MFRKAYIVSFLLMLPGIGFAQPKNQQAALKAYFAQQYEQAKVYIDSAAVHPKTKDDGKTWVYKGFIYKELYNQKEKSDKESPLRIEALEAFKKFFDSGMKSDLTDQAKSGFIYLCTTMYNDGATSLTPDDYERAIRNYELYKKYMRIIEPDYDFQSSEIQFNMVLGQQYSTLYERNPERKELFNKIKNCYLYVLDLKPDHRGANYNLGIHYYNQAVNIIQEMDYELDLVTVDVILDECIELFRKSLPYMQKAYELNPYRKDVLIGLAGIYFSLNELEKSQEVEIELKQLEEREK